MRLITRPKRPNGRRCVTRSLTMVSNRKQTHEENTLNPDGPREPDNREC
jgi:hypothetical protein